MKPFEIFRTGKHTSNQGATLTFSDADLSMIVAGYNAELHHAPIVVGHPKHDMPAYGWVKSLEAKGDRLVAVPEEIDPAFSDLVKGRKFRKVSAAFYQPTSPNNPTPGHYYLRHVGFLGAAAPAVKGLKEAEFSDDDLVIEFDDTEFVDWRGVWAVDAATRMFRNMRDYFIETVGLEVADKVVPKFELDELTRTAADMRAEADKPALAYAEPTATKEPTMPDADAQRAADLETREQQLADREARQAEKDAAKQAELDAQKAAADAAFVDAIVNDGRLPIGLKATATALFADLGDEVLTFSDGDEEKTTTPRDAFRSLLQSLPKPVVTQELANGDPGVDFSDTEQVTAAIAKEIEDAKAKGQAISPAEAAGRLRAK